MAPYQSPHAAAYAQTSNNNPPAASTPLSPSRYGLYTSHQGHPQRSMQRMPSYDAGDDAGLIDPSHLQHLRSIDGDPRYALTTGGYEFGETAQRADGVDWEDRLDHRYVQQTGLGSPPQASRNRGLSHSSSRYQYAPPLPSVSTSQQRPYNPQEYAIPPTPSQQQVGFNSNMSYTPTTPGPQPYNPAAYQPAHLTEFGASQTLQHQPSVTPSTPLSYGFPSQQIPPPPPPRGPDHPYGSRPSVSYGSGSSPDPSYGSSTQQATSAAVTPAQAAYSTTSPSISSSTAHASRDSITAPSLGSMSSRSYSRGSQGATYVPQSPRRTESVAPSTTFDERPPEPPAHSITGDDLNGKRLSFSRPTSRRSLPTPPSQPDPQSSPRRTDTLTRHPQSRPLPGPPVEVDLNAAPAPLAGTSGMGDLNAGPDEEMNYDDLMKEVEAAVMDGRIGGARRNNSGGHQEAIEEEVDDSIITSSDAGISPDDGQGHHNGNMATGMGEYVNYDAYSDDSEAEAEAGLAMLRMADEEERAQENRRQERTRRETNDSIFSAYGTHSSGRAGSSHQDEREYAGRVYGQNDDAYPRHVKYGRDEPYYDVPEYVDEEDERGRLTGMSGSFRSSDISADERGDYYSDEYDHHTMPNKSTYSFQRRPPSHARVDAGGTGGLSEPNAYARRMSFDYGDEEGDAPLEDGVDVHRSDSDSSGRGEPRELFFHPGMRPLPPAPVEPMKNVNVAPHLMPAGTYRRPDLGMVPGGSSHTQQPFVSPLSPDSFEQNVPSPTQVPRSTSLSTHPIGPRTDPPIRSKTDADRVKYKQQQELLRQQLGGGLRVDTFSQQADPMAIDLPSIPSARRKRFSPSKLSSDHFNRCAEPWALSAVLAWVREMSEGETDLKEQAVADAIVALFTHKVPTMNIADAETLAARVVSSMLAEGALMRDEEWVKFGTGKMSGVLFQITGTGCYSSRLHEQETETFGRCYSHHCMRTLKKVNLKAQMMEPEKKAEDWVTFYKVPKELWESYPKKEIDRQNNLHEIVTTEDAFIGQLDILRELYRDQLAAMQPSIITPKRLNKFLTDVFGRVDLVKRANEDFLLAQLKYRQKEQGPFLVGFSDIFREWIRKSKAAYIEYAATFPYANFLVRRESERNAHFRQFLNQARDHKLSHRLAWDTYLKAPITRIQRYTLLLATVLKNTLKDSGEKSNLAQAIEEIKQVALECDNKVGEMSKKVDLVELGSKLQLRPEMKNDVELNLEHLGREIIFRGDLQRPGTRTRFLVDTHAILFDHYFVLAKSITARDPTRTIKYEYYDVSKLPIPMDLLVLESTNDDPVVKSSVRGVSTVTPPQAARGTAGPNPLIHTSSTNSLVPTTVLESPKDDKILYPFRIKHLGKNGTYTLYAFSAQNRADWCEMIIEAKTKHAAALYAQNAEPFRLRVLADTAFANSDNTSGSKSVTIEGTPLDRAIKSVEEKYPGSGSRPVPICKTGVNCSTVFQQPPGRLMCAVGTDNGVYISDYNDPRGWARVCFYPIHSKDQLLTGVDYSHCARHAGRRVRGIQRLPSHFGSISDCVSFGRRVSCQWVSFTANSGVCPSGTAKVIRRSRSGIFCCGTHEGPAFGHV